MRYLAHRPGLLVSARHKLHGCIVSLGSSLERKTLGITQWGSGSNGTVAFHILQRKLLAITRPCNYCYEWNSPSSQHCTWDYTVYRYHIYRKQNRRAATLHNAVFHHW